MENIIYQKNFSQKVSDKSKIDIYIGGTNYITSSKEIKSLFLTVISNDIQLDTEFEINEIDSLIKFLQECREYIKEYNR